MSKIDFEIPESGSVEMRHLLASILNQKPCEQRSAWLNRLAQHLGIRRVRMHQIYYHPGCRLSADETAHLLATSGRLQSIQSQALHKGQSLQSQLEGAEREAIQHLYDICRRLLASYHNGHAA